MSRIDCNGLLEDYVGACHYAGAFDADAIEQSLREYLWALGVDRKIERLNSLCDLSGRRPLEQQIRTILRDIESGEGSAQPGRRPLVRMILRDIGWGEGSAQRCRDFVVGRDCPRDNSVLEALYHGGRQEREFGIDGRFDESRFFETHVAADSACASRALCTASHRYVRAVLQRRNDFVDGDRVLQFARWCVLFAGSRDWGDDLRWCAYAYVAAMKNGERRILAWLRPLFDAFASGCWMLHWTADTLYWVAKPIVHTDGRELVPLLHNASGPALESDVAALYAWHGVVVPARVITHPQSITICEIDGEANLEVRRVLIERYGTDRYYRDSGAQVIQRDACGLLYRKIVPGDEPIVMVRVLNSTSEPDGVVSREEAIEVFGKAAYAAVSAPEGSRFKEYMLRVPPETRTAREAVAWTFGMQADAYRPSIES